MPDILHTTILVFGVFTFNKHTLYSVVLHCTELWGIYYIHQFLYLRVSLLINIPCTVLYCAALYWNMLDILHITILISGVFTLHKHTLYSSVLYCTVLKYAGYTNITILILGVFTLHKHTLYSSVLHCTEICWIYYIQQFLYLGFHS